MPTELRLGAFFAPSRPLEELVPAARAWEAIGLDELWLAEDCFSHGGIASAATVLAVTDRLAVGIGLLPVVLRNAALTAMELATLAALHPGRLHVAFGHGVDAWMRQVDARPPNRLTALREVVEAVRRMLAGERVTADGAEVRLDGVVLDHELREPPRLLIGTTGERGLQLAGELTDAVLLPEGAGPDAVAWATGLAGVPATVYAWARVEDRREDALAHVVPVVEAWQAKGAYPKLAQHLSRPEDAVVAGTPEECAAALRALADAGAESVVLQPQGGDPEGQLARFAAEVRPLLDG